MFATITIFLRKNPKSLNTADYLLIQHTLLGNDTIKNFLFPRQQLLLQLLFGKKGKLMHFRNPLKPESVVNCVLQSAANFDSLEPVNLSPELRNFV
jgi:hypothetical protein